MRPARRGVYTRGAPCDGRTGPRPQRVLSKLSPGPRFMLGQFTATIVIHCTQRYT
nr:MAG TPA: hypothetical protein [Caudoviricetes sp.]